MINILVIGLIALGNATKQDNFDGEMKKVLKKYIQNVADIDSKYIINEALSKSISRYLKGKVNVFPLYKMSLKIDRNPVEIPWTIYENISQNESNEKFKYKYVEVKKNRQ